VLVATLIGAGAFSLVYWPLRELRQVEALLEEVSSRQRLFEFRLAGAGYAPVEGRRNEEKSSFAKPIVLLDAQSRIARQLARDPDNAEWLRLRARAEMLDRDYDAAVSTLKRASDVKPEDVTLLADLGCAYALRAERERRDIDYGAAIEMLWRFLHARPESPVALFNRAVVYERMFLYADAVKDWEHYLKLDRAGGWADEARRRKQAIERKVAAREEAVKSLASAAGYVKSVKDGRAYDPEFYLDAAITSWLPAAASDETAAEAVRTLARLLKEKHQDPWLEDLLRVKQDPRYWEATEHLAAARTHNLAERPDRALHEARAAKIIYGQTGVHGGDVGAH
jgi:tetratricopeptide (TPR) repeat protein